MVRFGREQKDDSIFKPGPQPPPNYFARSMQVRILMLVFLFMGVLWMMSEARKPENWQWMWRLDGRSPDEQRVRETEIDTRPPLKVAGSNTDEPIVTVAEKPDLVGLPDSDLATTAQMDGWNRVLRRLSKAQRQLFQDVMWSWRRGQPLADEQKIAWVQLLQRLDGDWTDYHARASLSVAQDNDHLTDEQKRESEAVIQSSKSAWDARKEALAALAQDQPLTKPQITTLSKLQQILDQRAWAQVKDNAVLRSAETEAWNRCWEKLNSLTPQQLSEADGPVNFVQLFSQPDELRGQLVRVNGTARWAYRVLSREPRFGIEAYFVIGLLPRDGSTSPIVVYSDRLPDGFPRIQPADATGKGMPLNITVEMTGYFFKRWLHRSESGMNLSPLILGRVTTWQPDAAGDAAGAQSRFSARTMIWASIALAAFAAGIAILAYRSGQWSSSDTAQSTQTPTSLPTFEKTNVRGNVGETLREFADQDKAP